MSRGFASNYRSGLLAAGLLVCFGALGVRLVWLHVIARDQLLRTIVRIRQSTHIEHARRGDILDAHGAILATSRPFIKLGVDPSVLRKEDEKKWPQFAALIGMPEPGLRRIFTTKCRAPAPANPAAAASSAGLVFDLHFKPAVPPAPADDAAAPDESDTDAAADDDSGGREIQYARLVDYLPLATYAEVEKLGIKGVIGERTYRRTYPHNTLGAHLLGFVNHIQQPVSGLERYADFYLRGQDGWWIGERDGRNRELAQFTTRDVPRADGCAVKLSLDVNVQDIIEQELGRLIKDYEPLKATIVVSDLRPGREGFLLGLANYPTFDPNEYNKVPRSEISRLNNIAVTDIYEPGSVFKIVAASGALDEHLVTPATTFDCALASVEYRGKTRSLPAEDHADHFDHPLTVAEIIAHSSNKGAAQLAMLLGEEKFCACARAFGFGQITGLPGGHEEPGRVWTPGSPGWDGLTITRMPMGHSVDVTVMQMHQAMSVIACGGLLLRPQVVTQVLDASGVPVANFGPTVVRRVISARTAATMARLLTGVASKNGTAPEAAIPGYEVAGKTGTTQKLVDVTLADGTTKKVYSTSHHVASFVGFFPASEPRVAISVIVDDADAHCPGGVAYGAKVAAPAFKRIGEQLIAYRALDLKAPAAATVNLLAMEGGPR